MAMNVQSIASLPDRINQIRTLTAEIVNKEILPNENALWRWRRDDGTYSDSDRQKARELRHEIQAKVKQSGLWAPHLPDEYGGFAAGNERDYLGMVVATEELSRASLAGAGSLITRPEILTKALIAGGTEGQKQSWLPRIASKIFSGTLISSMRWRALFFSSSVASASSSATSKMP